MKVPTRSHLILWTKETNLFNNKENHLTNGLLTRHQYLHIHHQEKNREALEKFLTPIEILDFGYEATIEYGRIRVDLEKKGTPIGPLDMLIASHAKSLGVILVTNNVREFERVTDLRVENWTRLD